MAGVYPLEVCLRNYRIRTPPRRGSTGRISSHPARDVNILYLEEPDEEPRPALDIEDSFDMALKNFS